MQGTGSPGQWLDNDHRISRHNNNQSNVYFEMPGLPKELTLTPAHLKNNNDDFGKKIIHNGFPKKGKSAEYGFGEQEGRRKINLAGHIKGPSCTVVGPSMKYDDEQDLKYRWENFNEDYVGEGRHSSQIYRRLRSRSLDRANGGKLSLSPYQRGSQEPNKEYNVIDGIIYDSHGNEQQWDNTSHLNNSPGGSRIERHHMANQSTKGNINTTKTNTTTSNTTSTSGAKGHTTTKTTTTTTSVREEGRVSRNSEEHQREHHQQYGHLSPALSPLVGGTPSRSNPCMSPDSQGRKTPTATGITRKSAFNGVNTFRVIHTELQEDPSHWKPRVRCNLSPKPELDKTPEELDAMRHTHFFDVVF